MANRPSASLSPPVSVPSGAVTVTVTPATGASPFSASLRVPRTVPGEPSSAWAAVNAQPGRSRAVSISAAVASKPALRARDVDARPLDFFEASIMCVLVADG
jgi:hypothetical protein